MKNKLVFLTKMSLSKKIKTKWFLIANLIFAIITIGLINIDSIIKAFGGDFNEEQTIMIIDKANCFEAFSNNYESYAKYVKDYDEVVIKKYDGAQKEAEKQIKEDNNNILLVINNDEENFIKAELISWDGIGTVTNTLINTTLTSIRSEKALKAYGIEKEVYDSINVPIQAKTKILNDENKDSSLTMASIMQIITLPIFMLIVFLVQMIGAEVNEEKTTKSMEIIISNVSPKTHFISKIISSNLFVLIQGALLIIFVLIGIAIRYFLCGGSLVGQLDSEITDVVNNLNLSGVTSTISYMLPIILVMLVLTFIAYSLLGGILASMTTNLEDYQQLQTPIVIISLIGYYLSMIASVFKGSVFLKIMSYIPLLSSMLSPTLYVMGEITLFDLLGSIVLLILFIYLLFKYGMRIYKVGILNYSQTGLWKKMFKAVKEK